MSFRDATIIAGHYKGWPIKAAEAFNHGASCDEVRKALVAEFETQKAEIEKRIAEIWALPTPVGEP